MTTQATIGFGSLFELYDVEASPVGFVTVGEVTSIKLPELSRDAVDATHTESPEGWREFIPGLKNAGDVTIEMNFVPGSVSDALIRAQFNLDSLSQCRISLPGESPAETLTFYAIVTGYSVEGPVDGKMAATLTAKVSGKPQYNA